MSLDYPQKGDRVVMTTGSPSFDAGDRGIIIDVNDQARAGIGYLVKFPRPFKPRVWCGPNELRVLQ